MLGRENAVELYRTSAVEFLLGDRLGSNLLSWLLAVVRLRWMGVVSKKRTQRVDDLAKTIRKCHGNA